MQVVDEKSLRSREKKWEEVAIRRRKNRRRVREVAKQPILSSTETTLRKGVDTHGGLTAKQR